MASVGRAWPTGSAARIAANACAGVNPSANAHMPDSSAGGSLPAITKTVKNTMWFVRTRYRVSRAGWTGGALAGESVLDGCDLLLADVGDEIRRHGGVCRTVEFQGGERPR